MLTTKLKRLEPRREIRFAAERIKLTAESPFINAVVKYTNGKLYRLEPSSDGSGLKLVKAEST